MTPRLPNHATASPDRAARSPAKRTSCRTFGATVSDALRGTLFLWVFSLAFCIFCFAAHAQEIFLQSYWQNTVPSASAAIWAGGNESSIDTTTATNGFTTNYWTQLSPSGGPPEARYGQTAVLNTSNGRMIVFGGVFGTVGNPPLGNDVWILQDARTNGGNTWQQLAISGTAPSKRGFQSAVYDQVNNRMIIFGGCPTVGNCNADVNDVWVLTNADGTSGTAGWTQLSPTGTLPSVRSYASAVYDQINNRMIIYGGNEGCENPDGDLWVLTSANGLGGTPSWTQLTTAGGGPGPRTEHSAVYDAANNRMILFGGQTTTSYTNDTWILSYANGLGGTAIWTLLSPTGPIPSPRASFTASYDPVMNTMVVFGGSTAFGATNDSWVLSNADGMGDAPTWTKLIPGGTLPGGRYDSSGVGVPGAGRIVIFDGEASAIYNDVWALQYDQSLVSTSGSPHSATGIYLAESAIGQMTPQTLGYPGAAANLAAAANASVSSGNAYLSTNYGFGLVSLPAVAWNVVFPGGFDPANGSNYTANAASTYVAGDIAQADYYLRALLQVNPTDTTAAQQLVLLVEDQMLPLEWSGTEALAYSTYSRLLGLTQNGTNVETLDVEQARSYFLSACNIYSVFLANPFNANLVEGQNLFVSSAVTNQVVEITEDYLRVLAEYGAASLTDFQLRSTANFYDPTSQGSQPSQPLLNDIDSTASQIQMMLLLASPFQKNLPVYTTSSAGQVKSILHDMRRLHQSIILGRITFSSGASGDPTGDPSLDYGEFTTSFVPIFTGLANPGNSSFDVALNLAETFTTYAAGQETAASNDVVAVLQRQYDWTSDQQNLQNQYLSQLQNLCGYVTDTNGNTFPDIYTASLPPGSRDALIAQVSTSGFQFNETGTIYQEWQSVEIAETNLLIATIELTNTFTTMVEDQQVGNAIYSNQVQLATLILTNGQQISAIDTQQGQVQAQADSAIAQVQATTAREEAFNTSLGQFASAFTFGIPPSFNLGGVVGGFATIINGFETATSDLAIGSIQANEATQIAAFTAQIEQINANEQAQSEYVQADTTALNLSAQLNSLGLQANSQAVQVQLAAQQLDQERSKLANLMSQVGSLLNQWIRSDSLVAQNPEFTGDLLIIRDNTIQQANDAFTLAQQWAFLTALSFNYKDNCPTASSYNFVQRVLAARNTSTLLPILNEMESAETLITAGCQSSPYFTTVQFSVRNNFVQANQTQVEGTNTVVTSYEPFLQGGTIVANASGSLTAWTNYLASNLITNELGERVLVLNFSTSLAAQITGGLQYNPLFSCDTFGTTLYSGLDGNGNQMHGVQISLATQGFTFPLGSAAGFNVLLAQAGNSAIRNRGFGNVASSAGFRYFNFGYFAAGITASANNLIGNGGTAAFEDRSPANGQWQLSINETDSANNEALINNLSQLSDIQLQFSVRSYIDQVAAQACTSGR